MALYAFLIKKAMMFQCQSLNYCSRRPELFWNWFLFISSPTSESSRQSSWITKLKRPYSFKACLLILTLLPRLWMHHSGQAECFPISAGFHTVILLIVKSPFFWGKADRMVNGRPDRHIQAARTALLLVFPIVTSSERVESSHLFFSPLKEQGFGVFCFVLFCKNQHLNSWTGKKKQKN